MPDNLNHDERAYAWLASWNPSFAGKAIVNPDFSFRAVNQQFCSILGVTAAELIGKKFSDITPEPLKSLDIQNAELVKKGLQESYLLPKIYELPSGKRVEVTLLVNGVYHSKTKDFLFFVSTIMARTEKFTSVSQSQAPTGLLDLVDSKKTVWTIIGVIAALVAATLEKCTK